MVSDCSPTVLDGELWCSKYPEMRLGDQRVCNRCKLTEGESMINANATRLRIVGKTQPYKRCEACES